MGQIELYKYVSKEYDERYYNDESTENEIIEKVLSEFVKNHKINSVVELGCGTGYWLNILFKLKIGQLLGIDGSKYMIDIAKNKYGQYLKFQEGDVTKLNFHLEEYDLVMCNKRVLRYLSWDKYSI